MGIDDLDDDLPNLKPDFSKKYKSGKAYAKNVSQSKSLLSSRRGGKVDLKYRVNRRKKLKVSLPKLNLPE